jgi:hypothetical protein
MSYVKAFMLPETADQDFPTDPRDYEMVTPADKAPAAAPRPPVENERPR